MNKESSKEYIFNSPNYIHIVVQYSGNIPKERKNDNGVYITKVNDDYAIISLNNNIIKKQQEMLDNNDRDYISGILKEYINIVNFKIIYISPQQLYTLQGISAIDAAQVSTVGVSTPLNLTGKGVIVGIIDTGIDYLSEEFRDNNGKSRILYIWDQTIES